MSGAMVATAIAVAAEVISTEVAFAIYAVNSVYQASQGNYIGAAMSAMGAYGVGGGFGEGGFGSSFGGAAEGAAGASGGLGDIATESYGYDPWGEVASDGWGAAGMDTGDFAYSLGGEVYSPADLPFNEAGLDISSGTGAYGDASGLATTSAESLDAAGNTMGTGLNSTGSIPDSAYGAATGDVASAAPPTTTSFDAGGGQGLSGTATGNFDTGSGVNFSETGGSSGVGMGGSEGGGISGGLEYSPTSSGGTGWTEATGTTPSASMGQGAGSTMSTYQPTTWDTMTRGAQTGMNSMYDKFMANPAMNTIKGAGSLYSMYNSNQAANQMQKAYAASDPFASQRGQYQNLLSQSYSDPSSVYKGSEYQNLQNLFLQDLKAKDAAAGRNSQYGARAAQSQNYFNTYLNNYRQGLQQAAGTGINPSGSSAQLAMAQAQQRKNMYDSATAGLTSIFG